MQSSSLYQKFLKSVFLISGLYRILIRFRASKVGWSVVIMLVLRNNKFSININDFMFSLRENKY